MSLVQGGIFTSLMSVMCDAQIHNAGENGGNVELLFLFLHSLFGNQLRSEATDHNRVFAAENQLIIKEKLNLNCGS